MKGKLTLSVEGELMQKAKDAQINISALTEDAIRRKLGEKIVQANETITCYFCYAPGEKETAEDVRESERKAKESNIPHTFIPTEYAEKTKLTWLCPEEKWICNKCLLVKIKSVSIAQS